MSRIDQKGLPGRAGRASERLSLLRRKIATIERQRPRSTPVLAPLGPEGIDRLLGGGLARGRLHEIFAVEAEDAGSAAGFAAMLALRLAPPGTILVWLREDRAHAQGGLHAPGLAELGIDPGRLILGMLPDAAGLLRAAADVVRCHEVGAAVIELWRNPSEVDLTASRRLALAAEASGVTALMLRIAAAPVPSAAHSRWEVCAAPSTVLEADAPGHPAMEIGLLRQRGGPGGLRWRMEWDRDESCFREAPFPGAVVSLSAGGPAVAREAEAHIRRVG